MRKNYDTTLPDSKVFGYGCINNTRIRVNEIDEKSKTTKAYKELVEKFRERFLPEDYIVIDILNGNRSERVRLKQIVQKLSENYAYLDSPKGFIVIPTLSELGTTPATVRKNYEYILYHRLAVLIFDNEELSCCDYGFDKYTKTTEEMEFILSNITAKDLVNRQGRDKTHILDQNFIDLYWYYENYYINEELALNNNLTGHFTKKVFYRLCSEYESSDRYETDEKEQIEKTHNMILNKPKRYGMTKKMKDLFPVLISFVNNGMDIYDACIKSGIHPMTESTYKRFLLRYETGKKGLTFASKEYYHHKISEKLKPLE